MIPKTAILCPGPSLATTWKGLCNHVYEPVIAVKRAILRGGADWWVSGDWMCFTECDAQPLQGYCSTLEVTQGLHKNTIIPKRLDPELGKMKTVAWEDLPFHRGYSTVAAIGLALYLFEKHSAPREVDIFGDDKSGDKDFDGHAGDNRGDNRWQEELSFTRDAIAFVTKRGMTVQHIKVSHG